MNEKEIDYIVIGAHKAGTSWLYKMFQQLPDFSKIPIKEFHFFDNSMNYDDIKTLSSIHFSKRIFDKKWLVLCCKLLIKSLYIKEINIKFLFHFIFKKYDDYWYVNFFKHFKKINGDITPSYSTLGKTDVERMFNLTSSKTKIIFVLRDPIERSWSNFTHAQKLGLYNNADENEMIKVLRSDFVTNRSNYLKTISNYKYYFSKQQFKLFFYDELKENPSIFLKKVVGFIGGNVENIDKFCNLRQRVNVSIKQDIPENILEFLKNQYQKDMKIMSELYGGYCTKWYQKYFEV